MEASHVSYRLNDQWLLQSLDDLVGASIDRQWNSPSKDAVEAADRIIEAVYGDPERQRKPKA